MNYREKADEIFSWARAHRTDELALTWENHSRGAAMVASRIASAAGMDSDKAYAMGLLHDVGRYKGIKTGMNHIINGYELLVERGMLEIARICLTHSFNPKEKVEILKLDDVEKEKFVKEFVREAEFDDYDRLIQLADFMAGSHGITTIERRFCSVLSRHELPEPQKVLRKLYELKEDFNKKCGIDDVYALFEDELQGVALRGVPGNVCLRGSENLNEFCKKEKEEA